MSGMRENGRNNAAWPERKGTQSLLRDARSNAPVCMTDEFGDAVGEGNASGRQIRRLSTRSRILVSTESQRRLPVRIEQRTRRKDRQVFLHDVIYSVAVESEECESWLGKKGARNNKSRLASSRPTRTLLIDPNNVLVEGCMAAAKKETRVYR